MCTAESNNISTINAQNTRVKKTVSQRGFMMRRPMVPCPANRIQKVCTIDTELQDRKGRIALGLKKGNALG